jgi:hypothetical protein
MSDKFRHTVYRADVEGVSAERQFVAVISRPGKLGMHLASFTFGSSHEEADRKARRAIWAWENPKEAKAGDYPADLDTTAEAEEEAI